MKEKRALGLELRKLNILLKRFIDSNRPSELDEYTAVHAWALRFFYENRSRDVFQRDFEEAFSIRRSTATKILQLMEKNEFIVRESVPYDARLKKIVLTEKAVRLYKIILADIDKNEKLFVRGISDEELEAFFATLDKIKANLEVKDD